MVAGRNKGRVIRKGVARLGKGDFGSKIARTQNFRKWSVRGFLPRIAEMAAVKVYLISLIC